MDLNFEDQNKYITFTITDDIFAVPAENVRGIYSVNSNIQYLTLPHSPDHIECVAKLNQELVTIVRLSGDSDDSKKMIIVIEYNGKRIGLAAHEAGLTHVPAQEISKDHITGSKSFPFNGSTCLLLDIPKLYRDIKA